MTQPIARICVNAFAGINYWFCHHYGGIVIEGTELTDEPTDTHCDACTIARPGYDEPPSFLQHQEQ